MFIAKIADQLVQVGDTIEVPHVSGDMLLKIIEIAESSFTVEWMTGDNAGAVDNLPFNIFGDSVSSHWVPDNSDDPNLAFLAKRMEDDGN